jgi:hypothetical protein
MKDWQIRAIKTFVQAFLGILIPELCAILKGTIPQDISGWLAVGVPVGCSALAAGLSAAWNITNEYLSNK